MDDDAVPYWANCLGVRFLFITGHELNDAARRAGVTRAEVLTLSPNWVPYARTLITPDGIKQVLDAMNFEYGPLGYSFSIIEET